MITKKELADKLHVSVSTIDRLMVKGLPVVKIGNAVRFEYEPVVEWIKNHQ